MQQSVNMSIQCVARLAGHDVVCCGRPHAGSNRGPYRRLFDRLHAMNRIVDRLVASASAEIALHHPWNVQSVFFAEACDGHDRSGGAKAALKTGRIHERLLDRMQIAVVRETFYRGYFVAFSSVGGNEAAVHRLAIEPDGTR